MIKADGYLFRGDAFSSKQAAIEILVHDREQELRFHETWEKEAKPYFFNDNKPKLSIPKKIAEGLDEENYKDLIDFIKEGFFVSEEVDKWYYGINQDQIDENGKFVVNKIDTNKSILIVAYLLSKTLGVDLVEVEG